jgi:ferritin-like metal-binding protein YciE
MDHAGYFSSAAISLRACATTCAENQVTRLEQVFEKLGQEPKDVDCPAIDDLIKEADEVAGEVVLCLSGLKGLRSNLARHHS